MPPKINLGKKIDKLYELKLKIDAQMAVVKKLNEEYSVLEDELLDTVAKENLEGALGKTARVSIRKSIVPTVQDWDVVFAYIAKNKAYDLVQKRISATAWKERLENGKTVPGIESFTKVSLSLTKTQQ